MNRLIRILTLCLLLTSLLSAQDEEFLRGDADVNGVVNLEDAVYLHWQGVRPCERAADVNGSDSLTDSDIVMLLRWCLGADVTIPDPGTEECGTDEDSRLTCFVPPSPCSAVEAPLTSTADYELSLGTGIGQEGQQAEVFVFLEALGDAGADDAAGVQFSICHDTDGLEYVSAESALEFLPEDVEIAFSEVHSGPDGWQGAVIFEDGSPLLRGGGAAPLFLARYDVLDTGDWDLTICENTGDHEVVPRVVAVDRDSFEPELVDGVVVEGNTDFQIRPEVKEVYLGGDTTLGILLDSDAADPVEGWRFTICFDPDAGVELDTDAISRGSALSGLDFDFETITVEDGVISFDALIDDGDALPAADGQVLYEIEFAEDELLDEFEFWLCSDLAARFFEVVVDGEDVKIPGWGPVGSLTILDTVDERFLRGDVDGNGEVSGIIDAIALLAWGFTGGEVPECLDTADVDDDGSLLPILDALFLLSWAFVDGPEPPHPSPTWCRSELSKLDGIPCLEETCD